MDTYRESAIGGNEMKKQTMPASVEQNRQKRNVLFGLSGMWRKYTQTINQDKKSAKRRNHFIYFPQYEQRLHDLHRRFVHFLEYQPQEEILERIETGTEVINNLVVIYQINDEKESMSGALFQDDTAGALIPCYAVVRNR